MKITLSSCFYILKSKFDSNKYQEWMNNLISIANNFNLVIYTDKHASLLINTYNKTNIKVVIKPIDCFIMYQFKEFWIHNHSNNHLLNENSPLNTCWELNMLWSEKVWFVNDTIMNKYFDTEFYGYCDIGYFRNTDRDTHSNNLQNWAAEEVISQLDHNKIHYSCVCNDVKLLNYLNKIVSKKKPSGVPTHPIPPIQQSIAGGFFILHKHLIGWWTFEYTNKLLVYFQNNYLVKDDQIILIDCILSQPNKFQLYQENNPYFDNWFMFQRLLNK